MLLRAGIALGLVLVGFTAFRLASRWQVARVQRSDGDASNGLLSRLRPGVPAIIYFWSPDCAPCFTLQKPAISTLQNELGSDGLQVLAINVYEQPEMADQWGVLSLPTTFLIDASGAPRGMNHGVAREDKLRRQLATLN